MASVKTTLIIPDALYRNIKQRAAARHCSISALVAEYLQTGMRATRSKNGKLPPLPSFNTGRLLIDVSSRDAIERALGPVG